MPVIPSPGHKNAEGRLDVDRKWSTLQDWDFLTAITDAQRRSSKETGSWRSDAREDFDFYAGNQWTTADKAKLESEMRPIVVFNRTAPTIDAVSGMQRFNRQQLAYLPRTTGPTPDQVPDAAIAEGFSATADFHRDQSETEDEESQMFQDAVICGMGWTETWVDYDTDPDGIIRSDHINPLEMYWDPTATKSNLRDSRWRGRVRMMHLTDIEDIWGISLPNTQDAESDQLLSYDTKQTAQNRYEGFMPVFQIQWFEREKITRFRDPETNEITELPQDEFNALVEAGAPFAGVSQTRRTFYQAFTAGSRLLERGKLHPPNRADQVLTDFTFQCVTGKLNRNDLTWHGLMRQMKDPQRFANKFLSQTMHIMNTGAKGGLLAEKSAFDNPQKAERDWARNDRIVWAAEGAISGPKPRVMDRTPPPMPAAIGELLQFSVSSIREVTGVNVEFLGIRGKFNPVGVEQSRIQQGMAVLSDVFDSLRRYRKIQGRVMLHLINLYVPDGTMVRISGTQDFAQYIRRPDIKYDVVIDQTPTTPNQKKEIWDQLVQILPAMFRANIPVPPEIIDYSPLPESVIRRMKEFYSRSQKEGDESQQVEMQQAKADVAQTMAKASRDQAQAQAALLNAQVNAEEIQLEHQAEMAGTQVKAIDVAARNSIEKLKAAIEALKEAKPEPKKEGTSAES